MARTPVVKNEKIESIESKNNDIEKKDVELSTAELINIAVANALKEFASKYKIADEPKTIIPEVKVKRRSKYVPNNAMVRVEQNIGGKFIIGDTRGNGYFFELNGYGDSVSIEYKDLKNFNGRNHSFLSSGKLKIVDVTSNEDITIEDVLQDLNLNSLYNDFDKISPIEIEEHLLEESVDNFESRLKKTPTIIETVVEVANILFKNGKFTNNNKMNILRSVTGMHSLFTN